MSDSIKKLEWRYACKKFDDRKLVSNAKIEKLKQAFNLTATSYGLQPIKMVVLHDKTVQQQLVPHTYGQLQVAQASHVLIICIERKIDSAYITDYFERVAQIRGTDKAILKPFEEALTRDFLKMEDEEIVQWATNQAYLALGTLMTICAIEAIDSCPMEGFIPSAYNDFLGLTQNGLNAVLVMPIGYRAVDDMFSDFKKVRKSIAESIIEMP